MTLSFSRGGWLSEARPGGDIIHSQHLSLDQKLLDAHDQSDCPSLVSLYTKAANECEQSGDTDAACFFLTHAYVFALQEGMSEANNLQARLVAYGREE